MFNKGTKTGALYPLPGPGQQTTEEQANKNRMLDSLKKIKTKKLSKEKADIVRKVIRIIGRAK